MNTDQQILTKLFDINAAETIHIIESFDDQEIAVFFESIPIESSTLLLSQMDRFRAVRVLEKTDRSFVTRVIEKLPMPVARVLLRQIEEPFRNSLINNLPLQVSKHLKLILKYPKDTVGAFLDTMVFTLPENINIKHGLEKIKKTHIPILPQVFILNQDHLLVGFIEINELITIDPEKPIRSIIKNNPIKISASMNISALQEDQIWNEPPSFLPVIDSKGTFLGVITRKILNEIRPGKNFREYQALQTGAALGELYQIGLAGIFQGIKEIVEHKT